MAHKLFSLVMMLVLALPVVIFAFAGDESKAPAPAEFMQKQIADAIKIYGEKKEIYRKDVLELFERKEKVESESQKLKAQMASEIDATIHLQEECRERRKQVDGENTAP